MLQRRRLERRHLVCIDAEGGAEHRWSVVFSVFHFHFSVLFESTLEKRLL